MTNPIAAQPLDQGICPYCGSILFYDPAHIRFINGRRTRPFKPFPLHHGDVVQLGQFELRIAFWHEKMAIRPR